MCENKNSACFEMGKRKSIDQYHFKHSNHILTRLRQRFPLEEHLLFITFKLNVRKQKIGLYRNRQTKIYWWVKFQPPVFIIRFENELFVVEIWSPEINLIITYKLKVCKRQKSTRIAMWGRKPIDWYYFKPNNHI